MWSDAPIDPRITSAMAMGDKMIEPGGRVKHYGERHTGSATATVVGFYHDPNTPHLQVRVKLDSQNCSYGNTWDLDRTEVPRD